MANSTGTQGGSHEQHVKAGQQSHKNTPSESSTKHESSSKQSGEHAGKSTQGGTHDQHVKAGQQSHKNS